MKENEIITINLDYAEVDTIFGALCVEVTKFLDDLRKKCRNEDEFRKLRNESVLFQLTSKFLYLKNQ